MLRLFWKLQEYRSTGTNIHLFAFFISVFLSSNPRGIKSAHIVLCKGLLSGKRVSRGRSVRSSQCDGGWDCRGAYPGAIPSSLFHRVPLLRTFTLLPRAAKRGTSGSSFFSKLFNILSCQCSRQGCVSSPHCILGCQRAPGVLGAAHRCAHWGTFLCGAWPQKGLTPLRHCSCKLLPQPWSSVLYWGLLGLLLV